MAVSVKKIALWRKEAANRPGALAGALEPLAEAGANLRIVMGYALPGEGGGAVIELFPVAGRKATAAASAAGLAVSTISCLLVEGDDRPGLGARLARAVAGEGVNISFLMAETIGRKFSALFGFANDADLAKAQRAIRAAAKPVKPAKRARRR